MGAELIVSFLFFSFNSSLPRWRERSLEHSRRRKWLQLRKHEEMTEQDPGPGPGPSLARDWLGIFRADLLL